MWRSGWRSPPSAGTASLARLLRCLSLLPRLPRDSPWCLQGQGVALGDVAGPDEAAVVVWEQVLLVGVLKVFNGVPSPVN